MTTGAVALAVGTVTTVPAVLLGSLPLFLVGTAVAGVGFGAAFLGAFRTLAALSALAAPDQRGALVGAVYVVAYLSFSVPTLLAGALVGLWGLRATAAGYAVVVAVLALTSLVATHRSHRPGGP